MTADRSSSRFPPKAKDVLATERTRRDQWLALRIAELGAADRKLLREAAVVLEKLATS